MSTVIASPSSAVVTEIKAMWTLAWPMLVGQLATVGMGVADVAMTGHVSAEELAAVSLGASVWSIVLVTVMGVMMAINTVVAHEMGAANYHLIGHSVRQSLWKGVGVGLLACAAANLATLLFDHIGLDQAVNDTASMFLHVISLGMPAFACYRALYGYTTSINQTKPVMVIAIGGLLFNVFVNWLLVFGNLGMPRMGAVGCAVATAAGMWLMLAAMLAWIRVAPAYAQTFPFTHWEGPNRAEIGSMLRLGLPIGVTDFAEVSAFGALSAGFIALFRWEIARAYTSDPQVQQLCVQLLLFAALFQLSDATQVAASSAIRGYKVTRQPMLIQLVAFWVFSLPLGYVLGLAPAWFPWSPQAPMAAFGFWIGLVLGLTIAAVLLTWSLQVLSKNRAAHA